MFFVRIVVIAACALLAGGSNALAYATETLDVTARGDFVVQPGKQELFLSPGESVRRAITITSRIAEPMRFTVSVEDITGSDNRDQPVVLMGNERGPYSVRDYLHPDTSSFTLKLGERVSIPVTVSIPPDAEPGGYYGAVIIAGHPPSGSGQAKIVSRIASLFLVRVKGEVRQSGVLEDFRIRGGKRFYTEGPLTFEILYRNTGSVHETPYGIITVRNLLGATVAELPVDAYYALPNALRYREVPWKTKYLMGRYTATLTLHTGDPERTYERSIVFWVIPYRVLGGIAAAVFILILILRFIRGKFEIRVKR